MSVSGEMKFYKMLAEKWPTKKDVASEIINLQAIVGLPKGTEHFVSDIHGEYEHFIHIMRTASGVIKAKIYDTFKESLTNEQQTRLANLIYYPEEVLDRAKKDRDWYEETLLHLIEVCRTACGKYTRSKVRKALPEKYAYIIDELLNCDGKNINKEHYYNKIIESIISLDCADDFITEIAGVIRTLSIDHLHIVGDIFDRGPRPDIVMDTISQYKSVDIQWGNHDIVWMGAMMGNEACIAVSVANNLKYENIEFLEEGYGVSLRQLERFAVHNYSGKNHAEKMYKAMSVIRFKIEDRVMKENPEFGMTEKTRLDKIDFDNFTWCGYEMNSKEFPTIDRNDPCKLTPEEEQIIKGLKYSFMHSEKMQKHLNFLFSKGSIYLCYNGNLLYHGCIPLDKDGEFKKMRFKGRTFVGKDWLDFCEKQLRAIYTKTKNTSSDFAWYLWCGEWSPLFGKENMATFERMFLDDKTSHIENKLPYFAFQDNEDICKKILKEFGLKTSGHIINGHIPVKYKAGESPIKAKGRLLMIDGGMAKSYRKETGIAGYTLTFNSYGLTLTSHSSYEEIETIIENNLDMMSQKNVVEKATRRILVGDTDTGRKLFDDIEDLKTLMFLYNSGVIPEK